jgi:hypothetical protein
MDDLTRFADGVSSTCCNDPSDACNDGLPSHCDIECTPTIMEMQSACSSFLSANRFLSSLKADLDVVAATCPAIADPAACASMEQFSGYADAVTRACCDKDPNACVDGYPTQCDALCRATVLPMQANCNSYLEDNIRFLGDAKGEIERAAVLCGKDLCNPDPCQNSGVCSESSTDGSIAAGSIACACSAGYDGSTCGNDINECAVAPCENSGVCSESSTDSSIALGSYACECSAGYDGSTCENDINECAVTPCENSGVCSESSTNRSVAVGSYACECSAGYDGSTCGNDFNECAVTPCENSGVCSESSTDGSVAVGSYTCACGVGYEGSHCETDINECSPDPCPNGVACSESSVDTNVAVGTYLCACQVSAQCANCMATFSGGTAASCEQMGAMFVPPWDCGCLANGCQRLPGCPGSTEPTPEPGTRPPPPPLPEPTPEPAPPPPPLSCTECSGYVRTDMGGQIVSGLWGQCVWANGQCMTPAESGVHRWPCAGCGSSTAPGGH